MKSLVLVGLLVSIAALGGNHVDWSRGSVVDKDGQVRVGEISLQSIDLILFKADDQVTVYVPHQLRSFYFFDNSIKVNRKFASLKVGSRRTPLFYEVVVWGDVQVVRLAKNRNLLKHKLGGGSDYNYLIRRNHTYTKLDNFKRDVYGSMMEESPRLHDMVRKQQLSPFYVADIIEIVRLYNWLGRLPDEVTARSN